MSLIPSCNTLPRATRRTPKLKALKKCMPAAKGASEMAQSVECSPCRPEDLSPIPRTHIKSKSGGIFVIPTLGSQPNLLSKL